MGESSTRSSSWFDLPPAIRSLFAKFPIISYSAAELPQNSPAQHDNTHIFWSFQRSIDDQAPSFNPTCLKWQALLRFHDIHHVVKSATNHSSPSGSLPFILPHDRPSSPISAGKITKWISSQDGREELLHPKEEAYTALIDHDIRSAWLWAMYLNGHNFNRVASPLYCESASSNILVQRSIARQLKNAARDELLKSFSIIDPSELCERAGKALQALSSLLGEGQYFFGAASPGLFDASVFAYTHLLLEEDMRWANTMLTDLLLEHKNLVQHRDRLLQRYFP